MLDHQVIVIGAGPAGLMAAGQAAAAGARTLLLEKMDRPGYKLRLTGSGRCNLSNVAPSADFITHFGAGGPFLRQALALFFCDELRTFFAARGVPTAVDPTGRVYPASNQAREVLEALVRWIDEQGVTLLPRSPVRRLLFEGGRIVGVEMAGTPGDRVHRAAAVVVATGGASYPSTGSTGDGYRLAQAVGHTIVPTRPALVPLKTAGDLARGLQGLSLRQVTARVLIDGKARAQACGDLLFTHDGLSGPLVLSLSGRVVDALRAGQEVALSIDLLPGLDERALEARLLRDLDTHGKQRLRTLLQGLLPRKLVPVALTLAGIPPDRVGHQVTAPERGRLQAWLKDLRLPVSGHGPLAEAMVTAGGVDTGEVDPRTMASRLVKGLYFAGEVLDVDGDSGGYNLQAAFSSGWLAGRSAARQAQVDSS